MRVQGENRFATAIEASKRGFSGGAGTVVIATGRNWPDALGGSALAGVVDGPLLLTDTGSLPAPVLAEIRRLGAKKAYILGGRSAVGSGVESSLKAALGSAAVERLGGPDRYVTARLVANKVLSLQGSAFDGVILVATGDNYPDALAASPIAAAKGRPVILANPGSSAVYVPSSARSAVILGGTAAVPSRVESTLKSRLGASNVIRRGGADRFETASLVAEYGVSAGLQWDALAVTTGQNFPDALSGGAMCGSFGSVMLLCRSSSLPPSTSSRLSANKGGISTVHIVGGTGAVSEGVVSQMKAAMGE
ncbi:MAG: hypothetical protein C0418_00625 [Coriobacteriaceae bacterium]|nr:hypothetical protein [Coriobacteriaceae bacterium]